MILTELYKILSYILLHHRCEVLVLNFLLLSQLVLPLVWMVTFFFLKQRLWSYFYTSLYHDKINPNKRMLTCLHSCDWYSLYPNTTYFGGFPPLHDTPSEEIILESVAVHHLCFLCHQLFLDLPCLIVESVVA